MEQMTSTHHFQFWFALPCCLGLLRLDSKPTTLEHVQLWLEWAPKLLVLCFQVPSEHMTALETLATPFTHNGMDNKRWPRSVQNMTNNACPNKEHDHHNIIAQPSRHRSESGDALDARPIHDVACIIVKDQPTWPFASHAVDL